MPRCPNHEDSQICPDCTFRPASVHPRMTQQPRMRTARNYFVQADAGWLSLCPPEGACTNPRDHSSTDCYPTYLSLEDDGTDHEIMSYHEWLGRSYRTDRKCPGCFGAGTGARCCICGGVR